LGEHSYVTCLLFDDLPSKRVIDQLKEAEVKNIEQIRVPKIIAIVSHFSFMDAFKEVLMQLYRIHLSQQMHIPLERYILNIMEEIPVPDIGNILI